MASPLIGSNLYEGDARDGSVIYDDYRDSGDHGMTIRSVVAGGNQVDARDLEPRAVALGTSARGKGYSSRKFKQAQAWMRESYISPNEYMQDVRRGKYSGVQAEEPAGAADKNRRDLCARRRRRAVK